MTGKNLESFLFHTALLFLGTFGHDCKSKEEKPRKE
jgi:hypothetical protein